MWSFPRLVAKMKQEGSNSIWHGRGLGAQHAVSTYLETLDFYYISKLRSITYLYFQETGWDP